MNISSLKHPKIQARIYAAMRLAVNASNGVYSHCQKGAFQISPKQDGATVYIANRKGNNFIRVDYHKSVIDRNNFTQSGFTFYGEAGNISDTVIQSLRS